jgi:glycerophosphoryl diester phosphodiesterase
MPPSSPTHPKLVIAHRGASAYLPEHTFVAKAYAHALGADCLEQDVVLTRDDIPVVFHDLVLEEVTDVADRFPGRQRTDGHWYVIDLDYAELQTLEVHERVVPASGTPVYAGRFHERLGFRIHSLEEELRFIRGLNRATGRQAGLYTEVKSPAWHREHGKDLSTAVLDTLARFGFRDREDAVWLQCFDFEEIRRLKNQLGCRLKLVQLIGENDWAESSTDYEQLRTAAGLAELSRYADGIGPWIAHVVTWPSRGASPRCSSLVSDAHAVGLAVHPYTFRSDDLPEHAPSGAAVHEALFTLAGVDGLFTDFTDVTLAWLKSQPELRR